MRLPVKLVDTIKPKYNPFAEKAGMRKIAEQPPPEEAVAITETLEQLGFNIQMLSSERYLLEKLQTLNNKDLSKIREVFIKHNHTRFMKYFFSHQPFGNQKVYAEKIMKVSIERLAYLIKIGAMLLQTKVYLFWENSDLRV